MSITPKLDSLILGPQHNGIRMTPEEFDSITEYDDLYRYELIHGVVIVNPIPSAEERGPNQELGHLLLGYREDHPQGSSLDDTLEEEYVRTGDSRRRADRVIWAGLGRRPDLGSDIPTIVVEFVSAGLRNWQRDYVEKRDEYLALGVAEYWVFDRFERNLTVFRKTADAWEQQIVRENEVYRPELLPGFELALARLLAVADRWSAK
jgi:Uma2 family endonuclease